MQPGKPENVKVIGTTSSPPEVRLEWSGNNDINTYDVYRSTSPASLGEKINKTPVPLVMPKTTYADNATNSTTPPTVEMTYFYRIVAVGGITIADPSMIGDLGFWYKADALIANEDDLIDLWLDSGTIGKNVAAEGAARPTYKTSGPRGKPYIHFEPNQWFVGPFAAIDCALDRGTFFAVFRRPNHTEKFALMYYASSNEIWYPFRESAWNDGAVDAGWSIQGDEIHADPDWDGYDGEWHVFEATREPVEGAFEAHLDALESAWYSGNFTMAMPNFAKEIYINQLLNVPGWSPETDVAELIQFKSNLSTEDRDKVFYYLINKYITEVEKIYGPPSDITQVVVLGEEYVHDQLQAAIIAALRADASLTELLHDQREGIRWHHLTREQADIFPYIIVMRTDWKEDKRFKDARHGNLVYSFFIYMNQPSSRPTTDVAHRITKILEGQAGRTALKGAGATILSNLFLEGGPELYDEGIGLWFQERKLSLTVIFTES